MNIAKEGPEFVSVAVGTSRAYIRANEDIVRRVVRSYAEGVQLFKTNKAAALKMFENQLKVKDVEIQEDTYNQFREYLEFLPDNFRVRPDGANGRGRQLMTAELLDFAGKSADFVELLGAAHEILPHGAEPVRRIDLLVLDSGFFVAGPRRVSRCGRHQLNARGFL